MKESYDTPIVSQENTETLASNRFESFEHFQEFIRRSFIEGSGIDPELFDACVEFHRDQEFDYGGEVSTPIHDALGWEFTRFGHQVKEPLYGAFLKNEDGSNWQVIVSIWDEERQRPYQYKVPKKAGDRAYLPPVPPKIRKLVGDRYGIEVPLTGSFWEWLEDTDIPRNIPEGGKKGLCQLSMGYVAIPVYGCTCGVKTIDESGNKVKPFLISDLQRFASPDSRWLFCFDRDEKHKAKLSVAAGKKKLRLALNSNECFTADIIWKPEQGKGVDDLVVNNGSGSFDAAYQKAIAALEKALNKESTQSDSQKLLMPKQAAKELVERYREKWKYDLEHQTWRQWDKVWKAVPDEVFDQSVYRELESLPNVGYDTFSYFENVVKFLKIELLEREWQSFDRIEWIAFNDCVLEVKTGKTHNHSPGFGFTSCLEHNYLKLTAIDPHSTLLDQLRVVAPTFYGWATYSQKGDSLKVLKLLAICNGALKFRFFDLQMFVLLVGVPGAGKGTFARLLESMVGKQNHTSAKLHRLGEDNVIAAIIDSQLVICPDEKKHAGDFSGLLSLTGGDSIPYRPIYKPQANGKFYGTIVILANSNPFVGDTTGIDRRLCLTTFDVPLPTRDTAVELRMQREVAAITAIALSMPDQQVTELLQGTGASTIPDFKRQQWLHKAENDSVALFMEEMLVPTTQEDYIILGGKGNDPHTLYGAYVQMCEENNSKSLFTRNNFKSHFLEICREIGWHSVKEARFKNGWRLYGVRLRDPEDTIPRISDWLLSGVDGCRWCKPDVDPGVDLKSLPDKGDVDGVDENHMSIIPKARLEPNILSSVNNDVTSDTHLRFGSKTPFNDVTPPVLSTPSTSPAQGKGLGSTPGSAPHLHHLHQSTDNGASPSVITALTPTPEVVVLGRKDRKKIDRSTLVEKIVRVKAALGGEEVLVQAIQENTGRLIALNQETKRQMFITIDDIE